MTAEYLAQWTVPVTNRVFERYGLRFNLLSAEVITDDDLFDLVVPFDFEGQITVPAGDLPSTQALAGRPKQPWIDIFVVNSILGQFPDGEIFTPVGLGYYPVFSTTANQTLPEPHPIVVTGNGLGTTVAHELAHYFDLEHTVSESVPIADTTPLLDKYNLMYVGGPDIYLWELDYEAHLTKLQVRRLRESALSLRSSTLTALLAAAFD